MNIASKQLEDSRTTSEVFSRVISVGPDQAKAFLHNNAFNRKVRKNYVVSLAETMKRGEWVLNGQAITISESGRLLDGQHRLKAIVESGCCVPMLVSFNVKDNAFDTIDRGIRRTNGDVFGILGEKNSTALAAAVNILYAHENGGITAMTHHSGRASVRQLESLLDENADIRKWCDRCSSSKYMRSYLSASLAAFCFYVFSRHDRVMAEAFYTAVEKGAMLDVDNPAYQARERLEQFKNDYAVKVNRSMKIAVMFKCFKAFRDQKPIYRLRVSTTEKDIFQL